MYTERTRDLSYAAYLHVRGFDLSSTVHEGRVCYWIFDLPEPPEKEYLRYLKGQMVPAYAYSDSLKLLKRMAMRRR